MDFENLINAFIPYGLPSLIIGAVVGIACFSAEFFLKKGKSVDAILPLGGGFACYFIYAAVSLPAHTLFSEESLSACLLCGSLSAGIFVFIKNLKNGNVGGLDALTELLSCYLDVGKAKSVAKKIRTVFAEKLSEEELTEKIIAILSDMGINQAAAKSLVKQVVSLFADKLNGKDKQ